MPITATVTAKCGPGETVAAQVFTNITGMLVLPDRGILQLFTGGDTNSPAAYTFEISSATTFTVAISGKTYTVTIS